MLVHLLKGSISVSNDDLQMQVLSMYKEMLVTTVYAMDVRAVWNPIPDTMELCRVPDTMKVRYQV